MNGVKRKVGHKGGRKIKYNDPYHKKMREYQRRYTKENREAWNLAAREEIPLAEARKRLGIKYTPKPRKTRGRKQTKNHAKRKHKAE